MPGAVNVDRLLVKGVDVVAEAKQLPFATASIDEIVAINPAGAANEFFNPLGGDVSRVLKPGATVTVVAQPSNYAFRQLVHMSTEELKKLGFERVGAAIPVERRYLFGQASTISGRPLHMGKARQMTFRRLK